MHPKTCHCSERRPIGSRHVGSDRKSPEAEQSLGRAGPAKTRCIISLAAGSACPTAPQQAKSETCLKPLVVPVGDVRPPYTASTASRATSPFVACCTELLS